MNQCVVLKFSGSVAQGFAVTLQIGEDGELPAIEVMGNLPPNSNLQSAYQEWRSSYHQFGTFRLNAPKVQKTNVARTADCQSAAQELSDRLNGWLRSESFRPIREKWLEQLHPAQPLRILLQTEDALLQRLPWHQWELIDRYRQAELALSLPNYERLARSQPPHSKIRILAILGNSDGIDVKADRQLLTQLPDADVCFLVEPRRQELNDRLWAQTWDILFFAGHSFSAENSETGRLAINAAESLTIDELRYGLRKAIDRGLQFAVFNSCDGLGLARNLADLQIPQMIVMREPVPDRVAQTFLKSFLTAFSQGAAFYPAVREAREQLQGLEGEFLCATWLPIICQNPAATPPSWKTLRSVASIDRPPARLRFKPHIAAVLLTSLTVTLLVSALRYLGLLQSGELWAFDQMLRSRPAETGDARFLIVGITEADIQAQPGQGSLSDATLSQLLTQLDRAQPSVIGLDVYRDFPVAVGVPELSDRLQQMPNLIAVCKSSDPESQVTGIAPPPEVTVDRLGFSDFWEDADSILRRQVVFMTPDPASPCATPYAFSTQIAFRYLNARGITPRFTSDGNLQFGNTVLQRLLPHSGGYHRFDAQGNQILINYRATERIAPQVSLSQILSGQVQPDAIRDRIVLIGVVAESSGDLWSTPKGTSPGDRMPGVVVQAHLISQLLSATLDHRPLLWTWSFAGDAVWIWSWATVSGLLTLWLHSSPRRLLVALAIAGVALSGSCFSILCIQGGWIPVVPALLAIITTSGIIRYYRLRPS